MRKIAIVVFSLFSALNVQAQTTSGKVTYKETIKLDINFEGDMAQFAAMLPKEQVFNKTLYFTPEASLYQFDKAPENQEVDHTEGNATIKIKMDRPDEKIYMDIKAKKKIVMSPIGEAFIKLPPIVAMLRMGVEETSFK